MSKIVLQYLRGGVPTDAETQHTNNLKAKGLTVRHRNGKMVGEDEKVETTGINFVTGMVPEQYRTKHPEIEVLPFDAAACQKQFEAGKDKPGGAVDLDTLTKAEIAEKLTGAGVEFPANAKKDDLLSLLRKHLSAADADPLA